MNRRRSRRRRSRWGEQQQEEEDEREEEEEEEEGWGQSISPTSRTEVMLRPPFSTREVVKSRTSLRPSCPASLGGNRRQQQPQGRSVGRPQGDQTCLCVSAACSIVKTE